MGKDFGAGLLFGGITGAAVAAMLAPQRGEETRAVLAERWRSVSGGGAAGASGSSVVAWITQWQTGAADLYARGRTIVDEARARIDAAVDEGKAAADTQRHSLTEQQK